MGPSIHIPHIFNHLVYFLNLILNLGSHNKAHTSFNHRTFQSNREDILCLWRNLCCEQSDWQSKIKRIVRASKQTSNDVTRIERKSRREIHEE